MTNMAPEKMMYRMAREPTIAAGRPFPSSLERSAMKSDFQMCKFTAAFL